MASQDNAWQEKALISIEKIDATLGQYEFSSLTETIDVDQGDKDIEGVALINGGRVVKYTPEGDISLSLEMYPTGINGLSETPTGMANLFHGFTGTTGNNSHTRDKFRVTVLWTNDTSCSNAASTATAVSTSSQRFAIANAYLVSHKTSFTDGIMKVSATFKATPFDKSGDSNILEEEADDTALTALVAYTSSANFR